MDDIFTLLVGLSQLAADSVTPVDWIWFCVGVVVSPVAVQDELALQLRYVAYDLEYDSQFQAGCRLLFLASLTYVLSALLFWALEPAIAIVRYLIIELAILLMLFEKGPYLWEKVSFLFWRIRQRFF